jgi:protein gp37
MKTTKIDWCDSTINPVIGCPNGCEYCYARKINTRFGFVKDFSKPEFFSKRLKEFECKTPHSIFINSMSDIAFWEQWQLEEVIRAMHANLQHKYIAVTKDTLRNINIKNEVAFILFKHYGYLGYTATTQQALDNLQKNANCVSNTGFQFLNIEPILEPITLEYITDPEIEQIIIGAETGNRKGKVIPKKEWIDNIVKQADLYEIPIFMKGSLREIMGADFRQDKLIWEIGK